MSPIQFGGFFDLFGVFFVIVFLLTIGVFIFVLVRGISTWNRNNHSPRLTVQARIVSKRIDLSHTAHSGANSATNMHHTTWYFVTFEVESGDRMEFSVNGREYGLLAEGDFGQLTFQGTRYLSFQRG